MKTAIGQEFAKNPTGAFISLTKAMAVNELIPGLNPKPHLQSSWEKTIAAANQYYRPGQFTTFIGYEWTSMPEGKYNRSEEHTSELQSLMRISYAVFCLKKKKNTTK